MNNLFCEEEANLIKSIPLSLFQTNGIIIWNAKKNGGFTMSSAYNLACYCGEVNGDEPSGSAMIGEVKFLWKTLWRAYVPWKVKVCVWQCCMDALPMRANLRKKEWI